MKNLIIASPLSGTVTGTSGQGDFVIGNLLKRELSDFYRTSLVSEINIDFGSATEIDFISLIAHTGQGSVTVKAGTTDAVTDYTSGSLDLITGTDYGFDKNSFVLNLDTSQTYRYWKIEIDDTGNADGYIDIGRLYVTKKFQPTVNVSYGLGEGYIDNSRKTRKISGGTSSVIRTPLKTIEFSLDFGDKAEMYGELRDFDFYRGIARDIVIVPDYDDNTYFQKRFIYGTMDELNPIVIPAFSIYRKEFTLTELI